MDAHVVRQLRVRTNPSLFLVLRPLQQQVNQERDLDVDFMYMYVHSQRIDIAPPKHTNNRTIPIQPLAMGHFDEEDNFMLSHAHNVTEVAVIDDATTQAAIEETAYHPIPIFSGQIVADMLRSALDDSRVLDAYIAALEQQEKQLKIRADFLSGINSLAWKLHRDVLLKIFSYLPFTSVDQDHIASSPDNTSLSSALCMAAVCSWWRAVIISAPSLWGRFYVNEHPASVSIPSSPHLFQRKQRLLQRHLQQCPPPYPIQILIGPQSQGIPTELFKSSSRWALLAVEGITLHPFMTRTLREIATRPFPSLQHLLLPDTLSSNHGEEGFPAGTRLFTNAPNLCSITLTELSVRPSRKFIGLPWSQLHYLELDGFKNNYGSVVMYHVYDVMDLLQHTPFLEELHVLSVLNSLTTSSVDYSSVCLPHLQALHITGTGSPNLLGSLIGKCLALESLDARIFDDGRLSQRQLTQIREFLTSVPSLKTLALELKSEGATQTQLQSLLVPLAPSIIYLTVHALDNDYSLTPQLSNFSRLFTAMKEETSLQSALRLTTIVIHDSAGSNSEVDDIKEMIMQSFPGPIVHVQIYKPFTN